MSMDNAPVLSATNWTEFQSSLRHLEDKFEWLAALDRSSLITHGVTTDKLDESLRRLENVALIIRRARNCLAPINKLPPELLGLVFQRTVERHEPLAPFNSYPWKSIQAVCVYWRVTALHTPALWTEVRIPLEPLLEHQCRVISFLLDRSGSLPLTVYLARSIDMTPTDETLLDDICSDVWRIHELQVEVAGPDSFELLKTHKLLHVRALVVHDWYDEAMNNPNDPDEIPAREVELFRDIELPQLRVLVTHRVMFSWPTSSNLCELVLTRQKFLQDFEATRRFYTFLTSQLQLECLVLEEPLQIHRFASVIVRYSRDLVESMIASESMPRVTMPCLKRLRVYGHYSAQFIEKKLRMPQLQAKAYLNLESIYDDLGTIFTDSLDQDFLLQRKLFIGSRWAYSTPGAIVVTDGYTSFYAEDLHTWNCYWVNEVRHYLRHFALPSDVRQCSLHELWLWMDKREDLHQWQTEGDMPKLIDDLKALVDVRKLVLSHHLRFWLRTIMEQDLFPSLDELQIHQARDKHEAAVIEFVEARAQAGRPIKTLRFVQEKPHASGTDVSILGPGKERISQFVSHVDICLNRPLRLELPDACCNPSDAHQNWPPWQEYMELQIWR